MISGTKGTPRKPRKSANVSKRSQPLFADVWVIYKSDEDPGMWVAHSLNTDQIGMGDCVVAAVAALKRVVRALMDEASRDSSIQVFCAAPRDIRKKLVGARPLPQDLLDRAEELAARHGRAPRTPKADVLSSPVDLELIQQ